MAFVLLLAAAAASTTCANLNKQFEDHEKAWSEMHRLDQDSVNSASTFAANVQEIDNRYYAETGERRRDGAAARARADVEKAQRSMADTDQRMAEAGNRIVTLLIANKCKAPDHVASWTTHSR